MIKYHMVVQMIKPIKQTLQAFKKGKGQAIMREIDLKIPYLYVCTTYGTTLSGLFMINQHMYPKMRGGRPVCWNNNNAIFDVVREGGLFGIRTHPWFDSFFLGDKRVRFTQKNLVLTFSIFEM